MKLLILSSLVLIASGCAHTAQQSPAAPAAKPVAAAKVTIAPAKKASATVAAAAAPDRTACKAAGDERLLAIVNKGSGCSVEYTKASAMKEIATAEHETARCQDVYRRVRGRLEAAGFSCN